MARKLSDTEREEMFLAWLEKPTVRYVAQKCGVHHLTVRKYRVLEKWEARAKAIKVKATRKADTGISNLRAEQLIAGTKMRELGIKKLDKTKPEDIDARLAKDLIKEGIGIEKDAVGDVAPDTVVVLALPPGLENL